jgi:outer membrane protein TolC
VASRTRQAGYQFRAAQDRLDQTRRQVDQQVKDAFRGIQSSIEDVKARQAAVVSARSSLESTQAGLEVGTRTQVDVLNAQRNLFEAEFQYLSSRYELHHQRGQAPPGHQHPDPGGAGEGQRLAEPGRTWRRRHIRRSGE